MKTIDVTELSRRICVRERKRARACRICRLVLDAMLIALAFVITTLCVVRGAQTSRIQIEALGHK